MLQPAQIESLTDEEIVQRVVRGDRALFELIMRRHNESIYRAVRSILRNEADAEDAMQQAYVDAYAHLGDFAGKARFSTWRARPEGEPMNELADPDRNPEQRTQDAETQRLLAAAIDELPEHFRTVFVL